MAIVYAGGTVRNDLYTSITTVQQLLDAINVTMVAAGWTSTLAKPYTTAVFTGQPSDGDTITVDAQVYTFNTVLGGANSILIDTNAFTTYTNLKNALNGGAGAGSKYGTGTTVNATMEGGRMSGGGSSGSLIIQRKVGGYFTTPGVLESVANMTLTIAGSIQGGGYLWTSARTPQGLACVVYGGDFNDFANPPLNACARITMQNVENTIASTTYWTSAPNNPSPGGRLGLGIASSWRVIANRYSVVINGDGVPPTTEGAFFFGGVPYLYSPLAPLAIASVSGTTVTTAGAHGLTTGDNVCVRGTGIATIDSDYTVTVTGATTFIPNGVSTGGTSSTGWMGKIGSQIAECMFACFPDGTSKMFQSSGSAASTFFWSLLNGSTGGGNGGSPGGTGCPALVVPVKANVGDGANPAQFYSGQSLVSEPLVGMGNAPGTDFYIVGQLFSMVVLMQTLAANTTGTFDSNNWINLTYSNTGSSGSAEMSVLMQIP